MTVGLVRTSTALALSGRDHGHDVRVEFILYAGLPGAFVDLVADAAWLTGRRLTDLPLDEHPARQADRELDAHAAVGGADRRAAAHLILARLTPEGDDQFGSFWALRCISPAHDRRQRGVMLAVLRLSTSPG